MVNTSEVYNRIPEDIDSEERLKFWRAIEPAWAGYDASGISTYRTVDVVAELVRRGWMEAN